MRMRRQHKISLASLSTFPPTCPRRLPLYPPSLRKYLCIILPFAPSISPPACVRRSGWSHKDGRGRAPLLFLSSDSEARETPAPEPQRPGPGCHGNGARAPPPEGFVCSLCSCCFCLARRRGPHFARLAPGFLAFPQADWGAYARCLSAIRACSCVQLDTKGHS